MVIPSRGQKLIPLGFKTTPPPGTYIRLAPRSGLSVRESISVGAGVVDPDYTGEVSVLLVNHGDKDYHMKVGERCAQMIFEKFKSVTFQEGLIEKDTVRGETGSGSSISTSIAAFCAAATPGG